MNYQKQRTEKQIEASRLNGAKSKGPKTEEGKAKSSQNSVRHGFSDGHCLLYFNERDELYQDHLASYTARFVPADAVESALVLRMVHADWRSRRADYIEAAIVDFQMDRMLPELKAELNTWDQGTRIALGFQKSADNSRVLALLVRYRAAADRAYDKALACLRLLQRDRLRAEEEQMSSSPTAPEKPTRKLRLEPEPECSSPTLREAVTSSAPEAPASSICEALTPSLPEAFTPSTAELSTSMDDIASHSQQAIVPSSEIENAASEPDDIRPDPVEIPALQAVRHEATASSPLEKVTSEPDEVRLTPVEIPALPAAKHEPAADSLEVEKSTSEPDELQSPLVDILTLLAAPYAALVTPDAPLASDEICKHEPEVETAPYPEHSPAPHFSAHIKPHERQPRSPQTSTQKLSHEPELETTLNSERGPAPHFSAHIKPHERQLHRPQTSTQKWSHEPKHPSPYEPAA